MTQFGYWNKPVQCGLIDGGLGLLRGTNKKEEKNMAEYPITVGIQYPEKLSRLTTFFRYIMAIPQMIVLYFVAIAACIIWFISWWAILFTGKYPKGMFNFVSGYLRWMTRVSGYYFLLTDKYPPFSMS